MTADDLLEKARRWERPDHAARSKRAYTIVDPTIRHLASQAWSATQITDRLIEVKAWPKARRAALYAHVARLLSKL